MDLQHIFRETPRPPGPHDKPPHGMGFSKVRVTAQQRHQELCSGSSSFSPLPQASVSSSNNDASPHASFIQRELRRSSSCTAFVTILHFVCIGLGTHHAARRQCCGVGQIGHSDDQGRTIGLRRPEMAVRGHRSSNGHRPLTVSQLEFHAVLTTVLAMKRMPQ